MEKIVLKEQVTFCKCPYCTRDFAVVKDMDTPEVAEKPGNPAMVKPEKRKFMPYTDKEDKAILQMKKAGKSFAEMSQILGRGKEALMARYYANLRAAKQPKEMKIPKMSVPEMPEIPEVPEAPELAELQNLELE